MPKGSTSRPNNRKERKVVEAGKSASGARGTITMLKRDKKSAIRKKKSDKPAARKRSRLKGTKHKK